MQRFDKHWDAYTGSDGIDFINVRYYENQASVKAALLDNSLDAVIGDGVLDPEDVRDFKTNPAFDVVMTLPLQVSSRDSRSDELSGRNFIAQRCNVANTSIFSASAFSSCNF